METKPKIKGDKLVLALLSAFRTLVGELSKAGALNSEEFVEVLEETAATHRAAGDPNGLAPAISAIAAHLRTSFNETH